MWSIPPFHGPRPAGRKVEPLIADTLSPMDLSYLMYDWVLHHKRLAVAAYGARVLINDPIGPDIEASAGGPPGNSSQSKS